jgi:hypothetical protein
MGAGKIVLHRCSCRVDLAVQWSRIERMSESIQTMESEPLLGTADLSALIFRLGFLAPAADDAERIERLDLLERLKSAAAAAQALETADFRESQLTETEAARSALAAEGRRVPDPDSSVGAQVGLARRESPNLGRGKVRLALALSHDLPHTYAALCRGDISEARAEIVATETADLSREDRREVDAAIADDLELGDQKLREVLRRLVYRIDEAAVLRRRKRAHGERKVTSRRLADGMASVSAIVSDTDAAAMMNSLREAVDMAGAMEAKRPTGDKRSRGAQIADEFVDRLTNTLHGKKSPVAVKLVISAEALLGGDAEPARLEGCGLIPAAVARAMILAGSAARTTIQRIFRSPDDGSLVAMERGSRAFPPELLALLFIRDGGTCRTPYCDAPIRHGDHPKPWRAGGKTSAANGQGLCEACNYVKESPGWRHRVVSEDFETHTVEVTTPTGHTYISQAPPLPGPPLDQSWLESHVFNLVLAA